MGLSWYIRRLRAMSAGEVAYRVSQRCLQRRERAEFREPIPVYEVRAYGEPPEPVLSKLGLNLANDAFTAGRSIELLGGYGYDDYRTRWHAAFQSEGDWPVRFAHDYSFSAEGVPGDIRTNWELNRHHQFTVLAKSHFATGDDCYLKELSELFRDWNDKNPFLWGPEWSSPMENSIRLVNWLVAAAFLDATDGAGELARALRDRLADGSWVIAANVRRHYSRHSSANNHTVIEAVGVGIAAVVFGEEGWLLEAVSLLENEITRQTWPDGVNKEQALHYQLFVMEALCLLSHVLRASGHELPSELASLVRSMAGYARSCSVSNGRYIEFGDDDEGRILNLSPSKAGYPDYVLSLASLECGESVRWVRDVSADETVRWLYPDSELETAGAMPLRMPADIETFLDGGVTVLRTDEDAVLAVDHGPLGLGPLAAHGHADALSVQLYVDGVPVLVDPGTYIYNGDPEMRDLFRSTAVHNTVCVSGKDQSEMLGPFLWGKRSECEVERVFESGLAARCAWPDGATIHAREVEISPTIIDIKDRVHCPSETTSAVASFVFAPGTELVVEDSALLAIVSGLKLALYFEGAKDVCIDEVPCSSRYGSQVRAPRALVVMGRSEEGCVRTLKTMIRKAGK